ncbi:MAG: IS21-like element helper ATPase IstB [Dehalococcoidales bacterium]|nr:IS21-like element helper ATPase IstB [Dehalococcoidales bacterium]
MLIQMTTTRLRELFLNGMAEALEEQFEHPAATEALSFEERLGLLVDRELTCRRQKRVSRLLREARLRLDAHVEDLDYRASRGLDRSMLRALAQGDWIARRQDVLISGATGVGKTFVACALADAACRLGHSSRYYRVPRLLEELRIAQADGSLSRLMTQLARLDLLVIDDFGLAALDGPAARLLLEVVDDRSERRSTIVASQLPFGSWHDVIGDKTVADAILDRWIHRAHRIVMHGDSLRREPPTVTRQGG